MYYGIRPSERLLRRLAELGDSAPSYLAQPLLLSTQDDPDRSDDTLPAVKIVFAAYMMEGKVADLKLVFEHMHPTADWFDAWWICHRYVANNLSWQGLAEIEQPLRLVQALAILERIREKPLLPRSATSRPSNGTVSESDDEDIWLVIAHPFGDLEVSLATWIATGPGPRVGVRPVSARRKSTGKALPLSVIPLQYRNDDESRNRIASGELLDPWKKDE